MTDPDEAYAAALTRLPGIGPAHLVSLLRNSSPREAWERVRSGMEGSAQQGILEGDTRLPPGPPPSRWPEPEQWWEPRAAAGIRVTWYGCATYPTALVTDPQPPGVLFWTGRLDWLQRPCVALVGTRHATPDGRAVAFELGRDLAAAGVCVVSGLALGIDGAAHRGALEGLAAGGGAAGPVGVAASGVDIPYPSRHKLLWAQVAAEGAILSEALPGRPAEAWRFPVRNRIIAGLCRMVVVVESHARGGSLITAEAAMERGIDVRVVPGPVHSPASAGSNQLLYDGPGPVRHAQDVLDGIGLLRPAAPAGSASPPVDDEARRLLEAMGSRPQTLGEIMQATGMAMAAVAQKVEELEAKGFLHGERGWWVRVGKW